MEIVATLRAAGCVWAEAEAAALASRFTGSELADAVARRVSGIPLEHVLGVAEFAGVDVMLGPGCFVPRRRAEAVVDAAARIGGAVVVDLGTGCGAVAAALRTRLPNSEAHAVELDEHALLWARMNAATFGFTVHDGSWWDGLPASLRGCVDLAVAYLPHVPTDRLDKIHADFRLHEPTRSVDGGVDGLDPLRAVVEGVSAWLAPGGTFVTLVSSEQVDAARSIAPFSVEESGDDAVLLLGHRTSA